MQNQDLDQEHGYPGRLVDLYGGHGPADIALSAPESPDCTYANLAQQVDYIGRVLRACRIGETDVVAVILPNGPDMASAFLGVAAHATCAPLNPQFSAADLEFYFADLAVSAIVVPSGVDTKAREIATRFQIRLLEIDGARRPAGCFLFVGFESVPGEDARPGEPDGVALVLHTSGTTSRPKMVPLTRRNLCASALAIRETLALDRRDASLNVMPLFHIHGLVGVLLSSLAAGASVICTPGFDSAQFMHWLKVHKPTWYSAVPTIHQSVLEAFGEVKGADHGLRFIRSSSSALPPVVMTRLEAFFGVPVLEAYGMTEAAHQMTSNPLPPGKRKAGSVGVAAGPRVAIMDETGLQLPTRVVGEIVIQGQSVTAGYVDNPQANLTAFVDGWFRTGDQGYLDDEGYLYITGRLKEIINRAGEKISPREVDEVFLEHEAVGQAVTFAMPHPTLGEDVVTAVVLRSGSQINESELRTFAFQRLIPAKVPSQVLIIPSIPTGATGKVQRIGLHEKLAPLLRVPYVAAASTLERLLESIWKELLDVDRVGIHDNFFTLGGDSLRATRVVARIQEALSIELSAAELFRQPTIAEFAKTVTEAQSQHMANLAAYVEKLTNEEVEKMLASLAAPTTGT